jgi:hypothetical protein
VWRKTFLAVTLGLILSSRAGAVTGTLRVTEEFQVPLSRRGARDLCVKEEHDAELDRVIKTATIVRPDGA